MRQILQRYGHELIKLKAICGTSGSHGLQRLRRKDDWELKEEKESTGHTGHRSTVLRWIKGTYGNCIQLFLCLVLPVSIALGLTSLLDGGFVAAGFCQHMGPFNISLVVCLNADVWAESVLQSLSRGSVEHRPLINRVSNGILCSFFWEKKRCSVGTYKGWCVTGHP